jgi:hypothetical protein
MLIDSCYIYWADRLGRVYLNRQGYPAIRYNGKRRLFHRLIMGAKITSERVDHINHDTTDNRRSNLRIVSASQNSMNRKPNINNTSGHSGVLTKTEGRTWYATIGVQRKRHHLGSFPTHKQACDAYDSAAIKYFADFRYQNGDK